MTQKHQCIATYARQYPISVICRVLEVARSGYYAWKCRKPSQHQQQDDRLAAQIDTIFTRSRRTYGSPRVHAELRGQGVCCSRKRVARLMRQRRLVARQRRSHVRSKLFGTTSRSRRIAWSACLRRRPPIRNGSLLARIWQPVKGGCIWQW
jgi:transposase InsO family protein